jgi:hypothetical protein
MLARQHQPGAVVVHNARKYMQVKGKPSETAKGVSPTSELNQLNFTIARQIPKLQKTIARYSSQ